MILIGVDVGLGGALCAYGCEDDEGPSYIIDVIDMPTCEDGSRSEVDCYVVREWLERVSVTIGKPARAFVENVQPMPSIPDESGHRRTMGAATSFRFGLAVGQIRAALIMFGIPVELVHSRSWKPHFQLTAEKEPARQLVLQLFPQSAALFRRKLDHNRAESVLIAKYGEHLCRRRSQQKS